jgi:hypothetical protein
MDEKQGFFVKMDDKNTKNSFKGPFALLSEARSEARVIGPNLEIYHGVLSYTETDQVDATKLFLVKKLAKEK